MLLLLLNTARAADVLLPEFTAGTFSDFAAAERISEEIVVSISQRRISVDGPDIIFEQAEDLAVGCAEEPGCPSALLRRLPGRLVVVGKVTGSERGYEVSTDFYGPDDPSAIEELSWSVTESGFPGIADEIAETVAALLPLLAPLPDTTLDPEVLLDPDALLEPDPPDAFVESPLEPDPLDPRIASLPAQAQRRFSQSDQTVEAWLEEARVRAGVVTVELHGGAAFGDIVRRYDTRVAVSTADGGSFSQGAAYEYENFIQGKGGFLGAAVAYAPLWWLELGLYGGAMIVSKELTAGWEQIEAGVLVDEDSVTYKPTGALMAVLEPRLRTYLVATGPIKPYALGGVHTRFFDGYAVPDITGKVDYPDRPGGLGFGVTVGGGLALDTPGRLLVFVEVPWTWLLTPAPYLREGEGLTITPEQATGSQQMLNLRGGVGLKL